jgi:hypothetical protein
MGSLSLFLGDGFGSSGRKTAYQSADLEAAIADAILIDRLTS